MDRESKNASQQAESRLDRNRQTNTQVNSAQNIVIQNVDANRPQSMRALVKIRKKTERMVLRNENQRNWTSQAMQRPAKSQSNTRKITTLTKTSSRKSLNPWHPNFKFSSLKGGKNLIKKVYVPKSIRNFIPKAIFPKFRQNKSIATLIEKNKLILLQKAK
mmetsp:Transcript_11392/g.12936  ORF Transcript_11392/g.12936 Transcript_11392/m.12936 type:complete len:161 (+) Transcript_11392:823-1305(+)